MLDGFGKLERTLCHELCHVAAWLVDHTAKPPHGPVFKRWADRAMRLYTHLDITTCHAYQIFYPFRCRTALLLLLLMGRRMVLGQHKAGDAMARLPLLTAAATACLPPDGEVHTWGSSIFCAFPHPPLLLG